MARRRFGIWSDVVGSVLVAVWPAIVTIATLRNPSRYNPYAVYSGLGAVPFHALASLPTTDPNIYATSYTLGLRSALLLAHGHIPWWNPFEAMGAPLIGELQSAGLFPFTMLLLLHNGSLYFHLSLEAVAGLATYWLLREFRASPVVAAIGGMLYATNGTYAWLANAAFNPVCFLPLMLLGVERARRAAKAGSGGGWRWLAVGTGLALLAGFIETASLGLILVAFVAIQRGATLERAKVLAFVRKTLAGLAAGVAIAAPVLVAFRSYLQNGFVAEHAGNAALGKLGSSYVSMLVSPYLFGRIFGNSFPPVHNIWGAVGGYAGFALLALAVASLFGRRERGLRIVLAAWVGVCLADSVGLFGVRQLISSLPVIDHIVLYRYLPPSWELALVILAALALRDMATSSRAESMIAVTTGVLTSASVLLIGLHVAPNSVQASRALTPKSFHQSELLVVIVVAGLLLAALAPSFLRGALVGLVAVAEAAVLFAVPLLSWPAADPVDQRVAAFLTTHVGTQRFFALGPPSANFGSQLGIRQLNVVDLPVPKSLVAILATLDPYENPTIFTGVHQPNPGAPGPAQLLFHHLNLYEALGVRFVVAPTRLNLFRGRHTATLAYRDQRFEIWELPAPVPLARAPRCGLAVRNQDRYVVSCQHPSMLLRNELWFPGWTATVNGHSVAVVDRGRLQAVALPRGVSVVQLNFLPPDVPVAAVACGVALVSLCVPWGVLATRRRRRREKRAAQTPAGLKALGATVATAAAPDGAPRTPPAPEPPTGAIPAPSHAPDAPTSAVPAVTGAVATVVADGSEDEAAPGDAGDPPTSVVSVIELRADPPTLAVPVERKQDGPGPAAPTEPSSDGGPPQGT